MAENDRNRSDDQRIEENEEYRAGEDSLMQVQGEGEEETVDSIQESSTGFVMMNTDVEDDEDSPLEDDEVDDFISVGTNVDGVMDQIKQFTSDEDIEDDFAERQEFANEGSDKFLERLQEHHSKKPQISGGDLDADWERADQSGEETVGATVSTPDQDRVEELGEAVGIEYQDDEPLDTYAKLRQRDDNRWELDPTSARELDDDYDEDLDEDELEELVDEDLDDEDIESLLDEDLSGDKDIEDEDLEDLIEEDDDLIDADLDDLDDDLDDLDDDFDEDED